MLLYGSAAKGALTRDVLHAASAPLYPVNTLLYYFIVTYEEAKEIALSMPEVTSKGEQYVEEFIEGFLAAMNEEEPEEQ